MWELIKLYKIKSVSGKEKKLSSFVQKKLDSLGVEYKTDEFYQIYNIKEHKPLVCAHMDSVAHAKHANKINIVGNKIIGNGNLGADDKNGVWILLKLIEKFGNDIGFIFSTQEEISSGNVLYPIENEIDIISTIPYCLVFDRQGKGDIIGIYNEYCDIDLQTEIEKIGGKFGYTANIGVFSDCDYIAEYIPCVNLSCGYYNAHSNKEYTIISEIKNALNFGIALIKSLPRKFYNIPDRFYTIKEKYEYYEDDELLYCSVCNQYFEDTDIINWIDLTCPICGNQLI